MIFFFLSFQLHLLQRLSYLISISDPVLLLLSMSEMTAFKTPKIVSVPFINSGQHWINTSTAEKIRGMSELGASSRNFLANFCTTKNIVSLFKRFLKGKEREWWWTEQRETRDEQQKRWGKKSILWTKKKRDVKNMAREIKLREWIGWRRMK